MTTNGTKLAQNIFLMVLFCPWDSTSAKIKYLFGFDANPYKPLIGNI